MSLPIIQYYSEIVNTSCATGDVHLADDNHDKRGRVEICYQGQWGTVCDDGWSSTDARVVCNQLGYSSLGIDRIRTSIFVFLIILHCTGAIVLSRGQYHEGSGPILLDNVGCHGTETSLLECSHPGIGVHNCQHDDDVGIECLCEFSSNIIRAIICRGREARFARLPTVPNSCKLHSNTCLHTVIKLNYERADPMYN